MISTGVAVIAGILIVIIAVGSLAAYMIVQSEQRKQEQQIERERENATRARQEADNAKRQADEILQKQAERERQIQLQQQAPPPVVVDVPTPDPRTIKVNARNVGRGGWWQPFTVPKGGGTLVGRLEGEGGMRGEFSVFIMTDEQLTDYRNGKTTPTMYSNEDLTVNDINANLAAGQYFLFIQSGSGWTNRNVTGTLRLK